MNLIKIKVDEAISKFENAMGQDWLEKNLIIIKENDGVAFGRQTNIDAMQVPIVAYYWYRAREEIAYCDITGNHNSLYYSLYIAMIGDDLETLERNNVESCCILSNLKNINESLRAMYQLCVASWYISKGYKLAISNKLLYLVAENKDILVRCFFKEAFTDEKRIEFIMTEIEGIPWQSNESRNVINALYMFNAPNLISTFIPKEIEIIALEMKKIIENQYRNQLLYIYYKLNCHDTYPLVARKACLLNDDCGDTIELLDQNLIFRY